MNLWAEDLEVNALIAELEAHPHRLNEGNSYGSSPLTRACGNSRWDLARILIEMGADVNSLNRANGTALQKAAHRGHLETIELLINHGADVNQADRNGYTALSAALGADHLQTALLLVRHGANPYAVTAAGRVILTYTRDEAEIPIITDAYAQWQLANQQ